MAKNFYLDYRTLSYAYYSLARVLVPINFTHNGRFRTELALKIPPLPDIEPAMRVSKAEGHMKSVIRTHLLRGTNRVAWAFEDSTNIVHRALAKIN